MDEGLTLRHTPKFLSLKWKVLIFSSIVLVGIVTTLSILSYISLRHQYEEQRIRAYQQHSIQVDGLIERSSQRLQQLGGMIPALADMRTALISNDSNQIKQAFNRHWPNLQIDLGIETVRLYSIKNQLLGSWNVSQVEKSITSTVLAWVWYVNERESPVTILDCSNNCIQYAIVPMLADGKSVGVALLGWSLADVVLGFKQVSGTDIGVIVVSEQNDKINEVQASRRLANWNANVVTITSPAQTLPILSKSAEQQKDLSLTGSGINTTIADHQYEVRMIPLKGIVNAGNADVVVITDITDYLARINSAIKQSSMTAILGLVFAESLLLAIMWIPMSRLRRTSLSLPLLSQKEFEKARQAVEIPHRWHRLDDETDVLDKTTIVLSHQLEKLEEKSKEHAAILSTRAKELALQKDFVTNLLDTAQAIIITQNDRGEVTMANQYGETLTGYGKNDLLGAPFTNLILKKDLTTDVFLDLQDLTSGRQTRLHHELTIVCKDESNRHIAWFHSRPTRHEHEDSAILSVGIDITDRKLAESRLSWLADHDPLTGLYNRRRFQLDLEQAISTALRYNHMGGLLFLDLDQFKDVNDSSGHQVGDMLLKEVADILSRAMRDSDMIARFGGDEFAIIIPETSHEGVADVARKMQEKLNGITIPISGRIHRISASIGISLFPQHGATSAEVLANADIAMYQAKENGRGCWQMFSGSDQIKERLHQRVYWKERLEQALVKENFIMYYQPIMHIKSETISHFETLIRLQNEDGSIVPPTVFIGIAEKTGIIHRIDRMVVHKAIMQLEKLVEAGHNVNFSINLSAHAFNDPELFASLKDILANSKVDPTRIIFEVTETAAVADFAAARKYMIAIKELGCRFALDDFGVGFSSFYSLKQLPVDYVKIDGSFISQLHENLDDQILVQALSQAAHGFGKKTVAEFVDNEQVLALLRKYDIDYAQGYLLGKPLPPEEAFKTLRPHENEKFQKHARQK